MNLRWLIGGGLVAGLVLAMPACGGDDDKGGTAEGGLPGVDGSLSDATPKQTDGGTGAPDATADIELLPSACNDGKLDPGETCDPLSSCPTECPPLNCQLRTLDNGGTCTAVCDDTAVQTTCLNGDGCCPT